MATIRPRRRYWNNVCRCIFAAVVLVYLYIFSRLEGSKTKSGIEQSLGDFVSEPVKGVKGNNIRVKPSASTKGLDKLLQGVADDGKKDMTVSRQEDNDRSEKGKDMHNEASGQSKEQYGGELPRRVNYEGGDGVKVSQKQKLQDKLDNIYQTTGKPYQGDLWELSDYAPQWMKGESGWDLSAKMVSRGLLTILKTILPGTRESARKSTNSTGSHTDLS
jgi:hypothetical protein